MSQILFLEGKSKIGKSTIILNNIRQYMPMENVGGFLCQRLIHKGIIKAYRLVPFNKVITPSAEYNTTMEDIFLENIDDKWIIKECVFCSKGIEMLSDINNKKLVLLDEIGGLELLNDKFREKLFEVLRNDIPVIGVLKSYSNAVIMKNTVGISDNYWLHYKKLREDIEILGGRILDVKTTNLLRVDKEVRRFFSK